MLIDVLRDPEFEELLPPAAPEAVKELQRQLQEDGGPRDPLVVWKNGSKRILVDGYRRHDICRKFGLTFAVEEKEFATRDEVKEWMLATQLARRNLEASKRAIVLADLAKLRRKRGEADAVGTVAKDTGVNPRTVYRAEKYAAALDKLPRDVKAFAERHGVSQNDVITLAELTHPQMRQLVREVDAGEYTSVKTALRGEPVEKVSDTVSNPAEKPKVAKADVDIPGQVDELGTEVPESLVPVFEARAQFRQLVRVCRELQWQFVDLSNGPAGVYLRPRMHEVATVFDKVIGVLEETTPATVDGDDWLPKGGEPKEERATT